MPKIESAFLIVTFNEPMSWVTASFNTIIEQTEKPKEIIHIDNSSEKRYNLEGTLNFGGIFYKYISPKLNISFTEALNLGLCSTSCELIFRQDPDDLSELNRVAKSIEYYKTNKVKIFGTRTSIICKRGNYVALSRKINEPINLDLLMKRNPLIHGSIAFHRPTILKYGGYNELLPKSQDFELYSWLAANNISIGYLPDVLYNLRIHSTSVSNHSSSSFQQAEISSAIKKQNIKWKKNPSKRITRFNYKVEQGEVHAQKQKIKHKRRIYRNKIYALSINGSTLKIFKYYNPSFNLIWIRGIILSLKPGIFHKFFYS